MTKFSQCNGAKVLFLNVSFIRTRTKTLKFGFQLNYILMNMTSLRDEL